MSELAHQVIRTSASVTGIQAKMSLDVNRGGKNEPAKFTIVGLWGKYIFKLQSAKYPCLPELEDLTMKMADNQISQKQVEIDEALSRYEQNKTVQQEDNPDFDFSKGIRLNRPESE